MKTQKEAEDEFVATLTAADSSAVLTLCTQCMDLLKAKETDKALDMLYSIDDAGIAKPLTIQQREALAKRFQRFPVIRYRLDYLSFSTQGNKIFNVTSAAETKQLKKITGLDKNQ